MLAAFCSREVPTSPPGMWADVQDEVTTPQNMTPACDSHFLQRIIQHSPVTPVPPTFHGQQDCIRLEAVTAMPLNPQLELEGMPTYPHSSLILPFSQDLNDFP